ncbi:hypothetical protein ACH4T9_12805 [Micromonospora sp. NPDC020750]|uniref:hypothetical protein n=1 Tax=unclassified Micromonospora TaxID=2617518 RepID=UPI00379FB368
MPRTIATQPVVTYTGTLTHLHGMWTVTDNYGTHLKLASLNDLTITCRVINTTPASLPPLTEKRATALHELWDNHTLGRINDTRTRNWLVANKLVEVDPDRDGCYRLTTLGAVATRASRRWWRSGY